ncbi:MAG: FkbM family methyltransferase [Spirochaetes bacterium]|nr:FkbM family methyltransferase [Spirochaetota bacterium]
MAKGFPKCYDLNNFDKVTTNRFGFDLLISPRYKILYVDEVYEEMTSLLIGQNAKGVSTFIDVGAHFGFFSVLVGLCNPLCKILAFEPVPENVAVMQKNFTLNGVNAVVNQAAVSDSSGRKTFQISEASDNSGFIANPNDGVIGAIETDVVRLDQYCDQVAEGPVMIKIDTVGNELKVLGGMKGLIEQCSDLRLIVEFNPACLEANGSRADSLLDQIERLGFDAFFIDDKELRYDRYRPGSGWREIIGKRGKMNLFCIKKQRSLSLCVFSHSSDLAGAERSLLELLDSLTKKYGTVCTVIFPNDGPLVRMLNERGAAIVITGFQWWCAVTLPLYKEIRSLMHGSFENIERIYPAIAKMDPDVVLTNTVVIPWGAVTAFKLDRPHIWRVSEFAAFEFYYTEKKTLEIIEASANNILVVSRAIKETLFKNTDPEKCAVSGYGNIALSEETESAQKIFTYNNSIKLIISGTVSSHKGQDDAVHAIMKLLHVGYNVELCILGNVASPFGQVLNALVSEEGLDERIHFVDFVENVRGIIEQADVGLMCSRNEAFGRVTVEAMMLGKPVIGTNTGGTVEIIEDGVDGLLYAPGDVDQLAEKMVFFIENPEKIGEFGKRAKKSVSRRLSERPDDEYIYRLSQGLKGKPNPKSTRLARLVSEWEEDVGPEGTPQDQTQVLRNAGDKIDVGVTMSRRMRDLLFPPGSWRSSATKKALHLFTFSSSRTSNCELKRNVRFINKSVYFNREWYLTHYPEVVREGMDPALHYLSIGGLNKLDPGPDFSSEWYLAHYPDVQASGINPLVHYLRYGKREGRVGKPGAFKKIDG